MTTACHRTSVPARHWPARTAGNVLRETSGRLASLPPLPFDYNWHLVDPWRDLLQSFLDRTDMPIDEWERVPYQERKKLEPLIESDGTSTSLWMMAVFGRNPASPRTATLFRSRTAGSRAAVSDANSTAMSCCCMMTSRRWFAWANWCGSRPISPRRRMML